MRTDNGSLTTASRYNLRVTTSLFDLYKIGVGPSSSHTMGPMRAACRFARELGAHGLLERVKRVQVELLDRLRSRGWGTQRIAPCCSACRAMSRRRSIPAVIESTVADIRGPKRMNLAGTRSIGFDEARDLVFQRGTDVSAGRKRLNIPTECGSRRLTMQAWRSNQRTFFSIGGGFIVEDGAELQGEKAAPRFHFLFTQRRSCWPLQQANDLSISQVMLENECALVANGPERLPVEAVRAGIDRIWQTMQDCIERGIATEGILPGGLNVRRRAHRLAERLREKEANGLRGDPLAPLDWVTVYAMAVNEENAAGGRVVTAPTNGAAGVVPAVAHYYKRFASRGGSRRHASLLPDLGGHRHPL